jgi:hypothetical protein
LQIKARLVRKTELEAPTNRTHYGWSEKGVRAERRFMIEEEKFAKCEQFEQSSRDQMRVDWVATRRRGNQTVHGKLPAVWAGKINLCFFSLSGLKKLD